MLTNVRGPETWQLTAPAAATLHCAATESARKTQQGVHQLTPELAL